jgi:nicotinate-nucleotide pyrophosphorylase (carboxylating)
MNDSTLRLIRAALAEDIGTGDLTSRYFLPPGHRSRARMLVKQPGVLCGGAIAVAVFHEVDPSIEVTLLIPDGTEVEPGTIWMEARGATASLLTAERVALNFVQRFSGIATATRRYVKAAQPHKAAILDTRKTTPGLREWEKAAVATGGGKNHRMGLYDMVMVKDNHLAALGGGQGLQDAIHHFRAEQPGIRVEVEAATLDQVRDFVGMEGIDVMLLDNMSLDQLREAVTIVNGKILLEASGGVNLSTVNAIAATGVDLISVGALTHSSPALDISLDLVTDPAS